MHVCVSDYVSDSMFDSVSDAILLPISTPTQFPTLHIAVFVWFIHQRWHWMGPTIKLLQAQGLGICAGF